MKYALTGRNAFGGDLFGDLEDFFFAPVSKNGGPRTDIREKEGNYILDMDLPGYDRNDVCVEVENGYLTVRAERKAEKEQSEENGKYIRRERSYGAVSRSFYVGDVDEQDVKACYKDGTLSVTFPKGSKKQEEKKRILIE